MIHHHFQSLIYKFIKKNSKWDIVIIRKYSKYPHTPCPYAPTPLSFSMCNCEDADAILDNEKEHLIQNYFKVKKFQKEKKSKKKVE